MFEPSEIRRRMLTDDDDLIRVQDIPERMQLATSSLSLNATLSTHTAMTEADMDGAAMWVTQRISLRKTREFFGVDGQFQHLRGALVMAVQSTLRFLFLEVLEVPVIWAHKRDHLCHFDITDISTRKELLSLNELWRIYTLGQKYQSLLERKRSLALLYERLQVQDEYYEREILPRVDEVEPVADATEWLLLKYKKKKNDAVEARLQDDGEAGIRKPKMPSRISVYEIAKKGLVSKLAEVSLDISLFYLCLIHLGIWDGAISSSREFRGSGSRALCPRSRIEPFFVRRTICGPGSDESPDT